jgi:hypothetical protein
MLKLAFIALEAASWGVEEMTSTIKVVRRSQRSNKGRTYWGKEVAMSSVPRSTKTYAEITTARRNLTEESKLRYRGKRAIKRAQREMRM